MRRTLQTILYLSSHVYFLRIYTGAEIAKESNSRAVPETRPFQVRR